MYNRLFIFRKVKIKYKKVRIKRKRKAGNKTEYLKYKKRARALVLERLEHYNKFYGFVYHKIAIRNQRSRWGSCSKKGNLNFNYKIVLLPQNMSDYVIVHELCHLGEFNHSHNFWALVVKTVPDYKQIRKAMKSINSPKYDAS